MQTTRPYPSHFVSPQRLDSPMVQYYSNSQPADVLYAANLTGFQPLEDWHIGLVSVFGRVPFRTLQNVYGVWRQTVGQPSSTGRLHIGAVTYLKYR